MEQAVTLILKYKKIIAITGGVILLLFFIIRIMSSYAVIYIDTASSFKPTNQVLYTSSDATTQKSLLSVFNLHLIPRDTKSIIVTASSSIKTQSELTLPWYGYAYKEVSLVHDKNAEKVAFNSTLSALCATYDGDSRLLSYTCESPDSLSEYTAPEAGLWQNNKIADLYYDDATAPYMGGIIGLSPSESTDVSQKSDIVAVTKEGRIIFYNTPDDFDTATINQARIFTDINDPTSNRFVLVDIQGNIYLGAPQEASGKVDYRQIPPPEKYNPDFNQTFCTVNGDTVQCYRGSSILGEQPDNFDPTNYAPDSLAELSFTDESINTRSVRNDSSVSLYNFYSTTSGQLFAKSSKKLYHLKKENNQYTLNEISQNVDSATGGKSLYFIQDNGVFEVDPKTLDSHQVFHSSRVIPKKLYSSANTLFIIGNVEGINGVTYAYRLTDENNTGSGKRIIDIIPANPLQQLPDTNSLDLVGDRVQIQLHLESRNNTKSDVLDEKKLNIIEALRARGVDTDKLTFSFTY